MDGTITPADGPLKPYDGPARGFVASPARDAVMASRRNTERDGFLLPIPHDDRARLTRLLSTDRRANLAARLEVFEHQLGPSMGFVDRLCATEDHIVWFPQYDQNTPDPAAGADEDDGDATRPAFAYTIGLYYLYNLPELLLIGGDLNTPLSAYDLARATNPIARAMIAGEYRPRPGDRLASDVTRVALTRALMGLPADVAAALETGAWTIAGERDQALYLGFCSWFHANFMDTLQFPTLVLRLGDTNP